MANFAIERSPALTNALVSYREPDGHHGRLVREPQQEESCSANTRGEVLRSEPGRSKERQPDR
jgi:hypothetical protein